MGRLFYSVAVDGGGDVEAARSAVWSEARRFVQAFLWPREYVEPNEYLDNADPLRVVDNADGRLYWTFPDLGGHCPLSSAAWTHWMRGAFAVDWDEYAAVAAAHGVTLTGSRPDREDRVRFVTLRGHLWKVPDGDTLYGDSRDLAVADLSNGERYDLDQARDLCRCNMCVTLRPDDTAIPNHFLDWFDGGDWPAMREGGWYLVRMRDTWPEVLYALIDAAESTDDDALGAMVDRYAPRVAEHRPAIEAYMAGLTNRAARAMAERALARIRDAATT